jgi:Peptidase U49
MNLSQLYDTPTLKYWGGRYKRSTTKIMDEVIWPALLSNEKPPHDRKPVLEFPLWAEGIARGHPLAVYAPVSSGRIVLPVFSLKFLDDLCTAYAWLQVNDYALESISEYTAILRWYRDPPPGGFPPPLKALHIPENALDDPTVDERALGDFVTARTFLLLHEMGHILYGHHDDPTPDESVRNEQQSDRFAATVMQRTGLPPLGMLVFFLADAHLSRFPASESDTHPLSGERVRALADNVDDASLAQGLRDLAVFFDDAEIREGFKATGIAGDLAALVPRRPKELPRQQSGPSQERRTALFDGVYRGEFVQFPELAPIPFELVLERRGERVRRGHFTVGLGFGTIKEGKIVGTRLYFNWEWLSNNGKGILEDLGEGSFSGTWGYREAQSGAGTWTGRIVT